MSVSELFKSIVIDYKQLLKNEFKRVFGFEPETVTSVFAHSTLKVVNDNNVKHYINQILNLTGITKKVENIELEFIVSVINEKEFETLMSNINRAKIFRLRNGWYLLNDCSLVKVNKRKMIYYSIQIYLS